MAPIGSLSRSLWLGGFGMLVHLVLSEALCVEGRLAGGCVDKAVTVPGALACWRGL